MYLGYKSGDHVGTFDEKNQRLKNLMQVYI
jgi:hypothetical protein